MICQQKTAGHGNIVDKKNVFINRYHKEQVESWKPILTKILMKRILGSFLYQYWLITVLAFKSSPNLYQQFCSWSLIFYLRSIHFITISIVYQLTSCCFLIFIAGSVNVFTVFPENRLGLITKSMNSNFDKIVIPTVNMLQENCGVWKTLIII